MQTETDHRWHAIFPAPGCERPVAEAFRLRGFQAFYPIEERKSVIRGKPVFTERAIIPGYVFVRFNAAAMWHEILAIPRVMGVLCMKGGNPAAIRDKDLRALRALRGRVETERAADVARRTVTLGSVVRITQGPFEGRECEVVEIGTGDVRVRLTLFGSDRAVPVGLANLEKVA